MAKKIMRHLARKRRAYLLSVLTVAVGVGFYLSFFAWNSAQALSAVTLADTDTTGYGLDGRDFNISWTPGEAPVGYVYTEIYITTSGPQLTTSTVKVNACNGSACQSRGFFMQYNMSSMMMPQYMQTDSTGATLATGSSYVAWVYVSTTNPAVSLMASSTALPYVAANYDIPSDTMAPMIEHMSVYSAIENAAAFIYAFVFDDQTTAAQFANVGDSGNEYLRLYYYNGGNWNSFATGTVAEGDLFEFLVPTTTVGAAGETFRYYLAAADGAATPNVKYFCADPSSNSAAACQSNPFTVNVAAAGSRTVAGIIAETGVSGGPAVPLEGAKVFAAGFAKRVVSTDGSGNYTVTQIPNNSSFDFTAAKVAHCKNMRFETIGTTNKTGVNINLNLGSCGSYQGGGGAVGGSGSPQVMFSGPQDGMQGVPLSERMRVGFNQPMDATTINDMNAADAASNSYLTTDDGTTKIAGTVTYCANSSTPGCSALFGMDGNVVLFTPSSSLATGTFYTFVMTESVKSSSGQSISGNRPGGGHKISFSTSGGDFSGGGWTMGNGGQFMPPYVKATVPAPGMSVAGNTKLLLEFSESMKTDTVNTTNVELWNVTGNSGVTLASVGLDNNEQRFVTVVPQSSLSAAEYELRVKGAVASASGISMRPADQAASMAFSTRFLVAGSDDVAGPTIYPMTASGTTGVAVNNVFGFGFNEKLDFSTINATNITLYRGATAVGITVKYNSSENNVYVVPNDVLAPNTAYTLTFGTAVKDLSSNSMATSTFTYTTGSSDSVAPALKEARCDDYTCRFVFTESMNHDTQVDSEWASSTLNHERFTLTQGGPDLLAAGKTMTYDAMDNALEVKGVGLTPGTNFTIAIAGVTDISGNNIANTSLTAPTENSANTFGNFGDAGMFGPPTAGMMGPGGTIGGGEFKPQGFGSFTTDQFAFGTAEMAFPFNPTASQDANVFQVKFSPGLVLQDNDQLVFTFPNGTGVTNAAPDTYSPFKNDMNGGGAGTVAFDTDYSSDGVAGDAAALTATVQLAVSGGTPAANDFYTVDLKKITNPAVPKDPSTGGYTVGIKVMRGGTVLANKTSMPYFIMPGGTNRLDIRVIAGTATTSPTTGANGAMFVRGGGPGGPMDKAITLTNGAISAVEGDSTNAIHYNNLSDGCYFVGTEPLVTLGGNDYFGQMSPEPVCLNGSASTTKYLLLTPATGSSSVTTTIKLAGIANFGGVDIDVFAGGPNKFVVKTLSAVGVPVAGGYTLKLPANGNWFIGVGPAMPKGASGAKPAALPGVPPSPIDVIVSGAGTDEAGVTRPGTPLPSSVSFNDNTDTITFTFAAADKTVAGTVKDGSGNGLGQVEVFMHRQGVGAPIFGTTNASGTFSLAISDYGMYEIGTWKDGLPPVMKNLDVRVDGADAGTDPDLFVDGKQITNANPLVLTVKKPDYSISGKILDGNGNGINYAPVFAVDANGNSAFGMSTDGGYYSIFVDAGTWTVKAELPPDKNDTCGSFSKTVTVTSASQSNQNISPTAGTCYTLSGSVSVGGSALANSPLFIEEWDSVNNRPAIGGFRRGASTDSNGAYSVKVTGSKTYRVGTWHPDYGELNATKAVTTESTTQNITVATTSTVSFVFTGGTASMNAFLELKNNTDATKRIGKQLTGLNTTTTITVTDGVTFNYFVDVFGVGQFTGQVTAGNTATVNLGVSNNGFVTVTGTIYSNVSTSSVLEGVLVTFINTSTGIMKTALTNASGTYSVSLKAGDYAVSADLAQHLPAAALQQTSFTTTTSGYDFGGGNPDQSALIVSDHVITGVLNNSSGAAMSEGYVWATNASGTVVTAPISATGTYSLPVTDGVWTVEGSGPKHAETAKSASVTVSGADSGGNSFNLTADATNVPTSTAGVLSASSGGSINDASASGIKITAGSGVLPTDAGSNITFNLEKTYKAPDTGVFDALGNAVFDITARGTSQVKDFRGNAEIQINYSDMVADLPTGVSESDLKLMYYSPERDEYVPLEGGFTIDAANNTISGQTKHLTELVLAYVPPAAAPAAPATPASPGGSSPGGGLPAPTASTTTLPAVTLTTPPVAAKTTVTAKTGLSAVVIANPASAVAVTAPTLASYQPGAALKFSYAYKNTTAKTVKVRVTRQLLDSKGKAVKTASAYKTLKKGASFTGKINEALPRNLRPGLYTERVRILDVKGKVLEENSFKIQMEKLKKKTFVLGAPESENSDLMFDVAALKKIKAGALPSTLKAKYSYTNTSGEKQNIRMTRTLVNSSGKVLSTAKGKWVMAVGEKDSAGFSQPLAASLAAGSYQIKLEALDYASGEKLAENSLSFTVELK